MDKKKRAKILAQVRLERGAARKVALELGLNKVHAHVHFTSKKDKEQKSSNTVRCWND